MRYIDSSIRSADETVAAWMEEVLQSGVRELRCQSGYFSIDGLSVLLPALKKCAADGLTVRLLLGSNDGVTVASHVAFAAGVLGIPRKNVAIGVVSFAGSLFHPKAYHIMREDGSQTAYVGSANLTGPAMEGSNIEAGIILDTREADTAAVLDKISSTIDAWFLNKSGGLSVISEPIDVDKLLEFGLLSLAPIRTAGSEGAASKEESGSRKSLPRLRPLFKLPGIETDRAPTGRKGPTPRTAAGRVLSHVSDKGRFLRHTESSYHYPQGTHPGHLLSTLYYFSGDRSGTAFDDEYIRLNGSLGEGRLAGYRRQIKYKLLAAIELGLITDPRAVENLADYEPKLTEKAERLWSSLQPYVSDRDLIIEAEDEGELSTKMPRSPSYYIETLRRAHEVSPELRELWFSIVLNMPAVKQLLQLLYHQERVRSVSKSRIYSSFFESKPVKAFCDEMGIEPATHEGARHRCPFLINLLDSCSIVTQNQDSVMVEKLALSADLLIKPEDDYDTVGRSRLAAIISSWPTAPASLSASDMNDLRRLFGDDFLSERYYLRELVSIPDEQ